MGIGSGIALIVIGAILYFAVDVSFGAIDIQMIGVILMLAGLAVAILSVVMLMSRRSTSRTVSQENVGGTTVTREERRDPGTY